MKSKREIEGRLNKLYLRYKRQHVNATQARCHRNCVFNHVVRTKNSPKRETNRVEKRSLPIANKSRAIIRVSIPSDNTHDGDLVFTDNDASIRVCTYGSEDPSTWNGDICDRDSIAENCGWFKPLKTPDEASEDYENLIKNDEYVLANYKDIATLQWVLDTRVKFRWFFWFFQVWSLITSRFFRLFQAKNLNSSIEEDSDMESLEGVWTNDNPSDS